jgi:DNA-binding NtrC family response regulator
LKSPDGVSESVINLKKIINYCTKKNDNKVVVFLGNSGTGKTFLAKYFHSLDRPESQFCCVPVNKFSNLKELSCFLFGERNHLKNTGFQHGLLNILNGGTLFLKNLETLDIAGLELIRTIILKRRFRPVDSLDNKYQKINCRIILAFTECNLLKKIGIKDFFKDVENIYLPVKNLSQRKDDIIWLSDSFLKQQSEMLVRDSRVLSKKILQRMKEYKWPGNIRELKQVVLTASLLSSEKLITQAFLPERILKNFR